MICKLPLKCPGHPIKHECHDDHDLRDVHKQTAHLMELLPEAPHEPVEIFHQTIRVPFKTFQQKSQVFHDLPCAHIVRQ